MAARLSAAMAYKGMSKKDLAKKAGKDPQQLYNMLYRDSMTLSTAVKLAGALDCDVVLQDRKTGKIY